MRKIIFLFILVTFLTLTTSANAVGVDSTTTTKTKLSTQSAVRQEIKTTAEETKMASLKERAAKEIQRRISFLNELSGKIDLVKKISDADKTTLKSQIQQQVDGLTVLLNKINSDTDLTTLKADVKSIVDGYYIYAFFRVKISLLVAADRLSVASANMDIIYNKLQTRVAELKSKGESVATLESNLTAMRKKIDSANLQYQSAKEALNGLDAQGYPKNRTSLVSARSKIKLGATDLRNAFKDASRIRLELGKMGEKLMLKSASGSALEN